MDLLIINCSCWYSYISFNYSLLLVNICVDGFEFFFLILSLNNVDFLVDCVICWLNKGFIFYSVVRNIDYFFLLLKCVSNRHNYRLSLLDCVFSINELRLSLNCFIEYCRLGDDFLLNWSNKLLLDDLWFGCNFLS